MIDDGQVRFRESENITIIPLNSIRFHINESLCT